MESRIRYWCYACSAEVRAEESISVCPDCGSDFLEILPDRAPPPEAPAVHLVSAEQIFGPQSIFQRLDAIFQSANREGRQLPPFLEMIRDVGFENFIMNLRDAPGHNSAPPATPQELDLVRQITKEETTPEMDKECAICAEPLLDDIALMPWGHIFHGRCLIDWLKIHNTCPNCRKSLSD